eukprot:TRINITY_DN38561_c0_g3_i1.p1 TRINITY_DN38561_c0_g3~~TRINITY_DN38561_c0_g3_i1.p1  ORF type:complete len:114 (+),score=13.17 TRINITY_DN38561_c0_g3_i1:224-565(+)
MGAMVAREQLPVDVVLQFAPHFTVREAVIISCCARGFLALRMTLQPEVGFLLGFDVRSRSAEPVLNRVEFLEQSLGARLLAQVFVPQLTLCRTPSASPPSTATVLTQSTALKQ